MLVLQWRNLVGALLGGVDDILLEVCEQSDKRGVAVGFEHPGVALPVLEHRIFGVVDANQRLDGFHIYTQAEVKRFAAVYWAALNRLDKLYAALAPAVERYSAKSEEERVDFRGALSDYNRLFAFLSRIIPWVDTDLEKLYQFARLLLRRIPPSRERLHIEM